MRTTLTLDDDVLASARALAAQRGVSIGTIVSELARRSLATFDRRIPAEAVPDGHVPCPAHTRGFSGGALAPSAATAC